MPTSQYLYSFKYDTTESQLCKLESRYIFNHEEKDKVLKSNKKVNPSHSAFIKKRLDIIASSYDYASLIDKVKNENIIVEGFKVEYLILVGDSTQYADRLDKLKDLGYSIEGNPDYYNPTINYAVCFYEGLWCFGILVKDELAWQKHNQKPYSYSNSIGVKLAKTLVNLATKSNQGIKLLDACCGAGTILLEACFEGIDVDGCDINWKMCKSARLNLDYYNYKAPVYRSDIKDISQGYGAAIVDLPYNLRSSATDDDLLHILVATAKLTDRLVIVSTSDITKLISKAGLKITDYCNVNKRGKANFTRKIWVCERELKLGDVTI